MTSASIAIGAIGFRAPAAGAPDDVPPAPLDVLGAYAADFPVVEIADTFNALPSPETLQAWAGRVPPTFRFLLTVPREVTHARRLRTPEGDLARIATRALNLEGRFGGLVFRMPTGGIADARRLEGVLAGRERGATWIFDLAGTAWDRADIARLIEDSGAVVRRHTPPSGRVDDRVSRRLADRPPAHARLALADEPSAFEPLRRWARWAVDAAAAGRDVVICCERRPAGGNADVARRLAQLVAELGQAEEAPRSAVR